MDRWRLGPMALAMACVTASAGAGFSQTPPETAVPAMAAPLQAVAAACTVPAGTPVDLELVDTVNSRTNHNGDRFAVRLRAPIRLGEAIVAPAGAAGSGEVVHAARARAGGKAGELIVAVRYVEAGGLRFPLRGTRVGPASGQSRDDEAMAVAVVVAPVAAFLVAGGEVNYPAGAAVSARLSAAVPIAAGCGSVAAIPIDHQEGMIR